MAANTCWRVIYRFVDSNKKALIDNEQVAYVIAADNKEATIKSVLTSNNIARPGGTLEIISSTLAPGNSTNVLS